MKKLWLGIALAGALSATTTQAAFDGVVSISDAPGLGTSSGGAFWIDITTVNTAAMTSVANFGDPFLSFCLEVGEHIKVPGVGYDANVSTSAKKGGTTTADPISKGTAWLYSQFRLGTLNSSLIANSYAGWTANDTGGNDLQNAIWYLEGEGGANNYLVTAAIALGGLGDANGLYGVRVLNLYNGPENSGAPDYRNQDMLAMVPEPSTVIAGALLLLPFGASTIRFLRNNRTA